MSRTEFSYMCCIQKLFILTDFLLLITVTILIHWKKSNGRYSVIVNAVYVWKIYKVATQICLLEKIEIN